MEYIDNNQFDLSYIKHTEQWFEVFQALSVDEYLKLIEQDPSFMP